MAEAEKASVIARATALKEKHALELQQEKQRHRQEQLDIDAEIAAATGKISVLNNSNNQSPKTCTDDMNAYYEKGTVMSCKKLLSTLMRRNICQRKLPSKEAQGL